MYVSNRTCSKAALYSPVCIRLSSRLISDEDEDEDEDEDDEDIVIAIKEILDGSIQNYDFY